MEILSQRSLQPIKPQKVVKWNEVTVMWKSGWFEKNYPCCYFIHLYKLSICSLTIHPFTKLACAMDRQALLWVLGGKKLY